MNKRSLITKRAICMTRPRSIQLPILLMITALSVARPATAPAAGPDPAPSVPCKKAREVFMLAVSKDFVTLEASLRACQKDYEQDIAKSLETEIALFSAYSGFESSYPALEPALNEWIIKYPTSYVAFSARGEYLLHKGHQARGTKSSDETTEQQFKAMTDTFSYAAQDLNHALNLYPGSIVASRDLISLHGSFGSQVAIGTVLRNGLRFHPDSFELRANYLHYIQPKWGGTPAALDAMLQEIELSSRKYNKLRPLLGYREFIIAEEALDDKDYGTAATHYLKALEYGARLPYYQQLARAYYLLGQYDRSIAASEKALQLGPIQSDQAVMHAGSLIQLGSLTESRRIIDQGLDRFPDNKNLLSIREYCTNLINGVYEISEEQTVSKPDTRAFRSVSILPTDVRILWPGDHRQKLYDTSNRITEAIERALKQAGIPCAKLPQAPPSLALPGYSFADLSDQDGSEIGHDLNADAVVITTYRAEFRSKPSRTYMVTMATRLVSTQTKAVHWKYILRGVFTEDRASVKDDVVLANLETQLFKRFQEQLRQKYDRKK